VSERIRGFIEKRRVAIAKISDAKDRSREEKVKVLDNIKEEIK
jgi:hypothetical protein